MQWFHLCSFYCVSSTTFEYAPKDIHRFVLIMHPGVCVCGDNHLVFLCFPGRRGERSLSLRAWAGNSHLICPRAHFHAGNLTNYLRSSRANLAATLSSFIQLLYIFGVHINTPCRVKWRVKVQIPKWLPASSTSWYEGFSSSFFRGKSFGSPSS